MIKANHFELGKPSETGVFQSVTQSAFVPAANINDYKGSINKERKADLRKNHFDFADSKQPSVKQSINTSTF